MKRCIGSVVMLISGLLFQCAAQQDSKPPAVDKAPAVNAALVEQREAVQTLLYLKNSIAEIEDLKDRVRVLLEVGDALWVFDKEQARDVFKQALVQTAKFEDSIAEGLPKNAAVSLRQKVIMRIARRDAAFANTLLKDLPLKTSEPTESDAFKQLYGRDDSRNEVLLNAASELLKTEAGSATQVARFAVAGGFSQAFRSFLLDLRSKDPQAANSLYDAVFQSASMRRPKELSEALFIWDYAFQHGTIYLGPVAWLGHQARSTDSVSTEVKRRALAFAVDTIVENIIRFNITTASESERPLIRERYVLIHSLASQIMPDVAKYMPGSLPLIETHLNRLDQTLRDLGRTPPVAPEPLPSTADVNDNVDKWLDIATRVSNPQLRDGVYGRAALSLYLHGQHERALEVAHKIDGASLALQLTDPIKFDQAGGLIANHQYDQAASIARTIEAPSVRATVLARLGVAYAEERQTTSASVAFGEAEDAAAKGNPSLDTASAVLVIAFNYVEADRPRAEDLIARAIKTLNSIEGEGPWEMLQNGVGSKGRLSAQDHDWSTGRGGTLTSLTVRYPRLVSLLDVLSKVAANDLNEGLMLSWQLKLKGLSYAAQAILCRQAIERAHERTKGANKGKRTSF